MQSTTAAETAVQIVDMISNDEAIGLIKLAAHTLDLDIAPARRAVNDFAGRLFACTVSELTPAQARDIRHHLAAGNLTPGRPAADQRTPTMPRKKPIEIEMTDAEYDAGLKAAEGGDAFGLLPKKNNGHRHAATTKPRKPLAELTDEEWAEREREAEANAAEQAAGDLHAERAKRNGKKKRGVADVVIGGGAWGDSALPALDAAAGRMGEEHPYVVRMIAIDVVAPAPFNPRRVFDPIKLSEVAQTMRERGVDNPLWVRPQPGMDERHGKFQLIAGERRLKAAALAGLAEVPCRVYRVDDAAAADMCFSENHDRADLNPIEEALSLDMMIRVGGYTQQQMAERIGVEQGTIANKLGVLKLPGAWQERIISGEVTPTHARALPKWADYPAVLAEVDKRIKERMRHDPYFPNSEEFTDIVTEAALHIGRPIEGAYSITTPNGGNRHGQVLFKPTAEQREQLRVEPVKSWSGKNVPHAFNVELWEELQAAAKREEKKRQQKQLDKAGKKAPAGPSPQSIRARQEAVEKARREKETRARNERVWLANWFRVRLAERINDWLDGDERLAILSTFLLADQNRSISLFHAAVNRTNGKVIQRRGDWRMEIDMFANLVATWPRLGKFQRLHCALWAAQEVGEHDRDETKMMPVIGAWAGVDLAKEWQPTADYLELLTAEELREVAAEWKVKKELYHGIGDRQTLINLLTQSNGHAKCPARLLALIAPAPGSGKKKKGRK